MPLFIPRLGKVYDAAVVEEAVCSSVRGLVSNSPTSEQMDVIMSILRGCDVFVSLPTGSGKSVCFSCLPLVFQKLSAGIFIAVIVSPLKSLMIDQVAKATASGVKAIYIGGDNLIDMPEARKDIVSGQYALIYMSPESLLGMRMWREVFRTGIYQQNLVCLAVDEAHLVEKWYDW
jgi:superfamily II DNA helicase RecQ